MRVVITGPTGAIGHALIKKCIENNDEVLAVCRKCSNRIKTIPQNPLVKILELDCDEYLSFSETYNKSLGKYDVFYHLAWGFTTGDGRNNVQQQSLNIQYAIDAVKLANSFDCKTFIGAGSQAEYGRVEGVLKSDTPVNPENGYGIAKLCAGQLTRIFCSHLGIRHIWARILSVYGPYDGENTLIISSLKKMLRNEDIPLTKGEQIWDFIYCSDAANAMYLLADKGLNGKTYVIGSGKGDYLKNYIKYMKMITDSNSNLEFGLIPYSDKQVMNLVADISDLKNDTGFYSQVDFFEGIKNTIEYIREFQKNE